MPGCSHARVMSAPLGPCYYPAGAEWAVVQARKSAYASSMAPYHIEAQGAVTAARAATLSDRWSSQAQAADEQENAAPAREIRSLQRKATSCGRRFALEVVGQPPGTRPEGWVNPSPPNRAGAAASRQSQSWHQQADSKPASFREARVSKTASTKGPGLSGAADEEDLWSAEELRDRALQHRATASPNRPLEPRDDELRLLERHQALIQAELAHSAQRTYEMEEKLRAEQRGLSNDLLAPADSPNQRPYLLTRSFAADHPWQTLAKIDPASADSSTASAGGPPTVGPAQTTPHLTLSERFDKGRRFQCPGSRPGVAEAQLNMPASGVGWVEWPLQRGGEAPLHASWQQHHSSGGAGGGLLPTGMCRVIPAGAALPDATWWLQQ